LTKLDTRRITGTAIMAALVILFDYTLRYSGLKIIFPWYPNLKFDFTGIPITLSLLLYGYPSAATTSLVAGLGILARSGNMVSSTMKTLAELLQVTGLSLGKYEKKPLLEGVIGIACRVVGMTAVNLLILPKAYGLPHRAVISLLPLIALFNTLQGILNIAISTYLYTATKRRLG